MALVIIINGRLLRKIFPDAFGPPIAQKAPLIQEKFQQVWIRPPSCRCKVKSVCSPELKFSSSELLGKFGAVPGCAPFELHGAGHTLNLRPKLRA